MATRTWDLDLTAKAGSRPRIVSAKDRGTNQISKSCGPIKAEIEKLKKQNVLNFALPGLAGEPDVSKKTQNTVAQGATSSVATTISAITLASHHKKQSNVPVSTLLTLMPFPKALRPTLRTLMTL